VLQHPEDLHALVKGVHLVSRSSDEDFDALAARTGINFHV
jgi:hypothetical protein